MRKHLMAAALVGLLTSPAYATVTVMVDPVPNGGLTIFDGLPANTFLPAGPLSLADGLTFAGTGEIFNGSFPNVAAQPAFTHDNYMAVLANGSETITFAHPTSTFRMVLGSSDVYGAVNVDGSLFTGSTLQTMYGVLDNGNQSSALSNVLLSFTGSSGMLNSITLTSSGNSLEFIPVSAPEPSTWAMMIMGFIGLGYAAKRKAHRKGVRLVVA